MGGLAFLCIPNRYLRYIHKYLKMPELDLFLNQTLTVSSSCPISWLKSTVNTRSTHWMILTHGQTFAIVGIILPKFKRSFRWNRFSNVAAWKISIMCFSPSFQICVKSWLYHCITTWNWLNFVLFLRDVLISSDLRLLSALETVSLEGCWWGWGKCWTPNPDSSLTIFKTHKCSFKYSCGLTPITWDYGKWKCTMRSLEINSYEKGKLFSGEKSITLPKSVTILLFSTTQLW